MTLISLIDFKMKNSDYKTAKISLLITLFNNNSPRK